jgi:glycosyltransferase involved in cell wall biosynthesis
MKTVSIIGSHGLYANYGGWDQLVKNLAEKNSSENIHYLIFNSKESPEFIEKIPDRVVIRRIKLKASGFEGLFYDFWSILICYFKSDTILLLGVQGIPLVALLRLFKRTNVVSNVGGLEWERPKFGLLAKLYLKFCFNCSFIFSNTVILDNEHYMKFVSESYRKKVLIIPYGGEISNRLEITEEIRSRYNFLNFEYYLSISRALKDNCIDELCRTFVGLKKRLVVISNFSSSEYGKSILDKYSNIENITLINGLYVKDELDLVRRKCKAYIHTHTLCGTAPSLVEMVICRRPIISIDVPQNRFTLANTGLYFKTFDDLEGILTCSADNLILSENSPDFLLERYEWQTIVNSYQDLY